MKKIIKTFIIISFLLVLCSCSENDKDHKLIEITSEELINNLMNGSEKKFVFAVYNSEKQNGDEFYKSLNDVVKNISTDIYYIDYQHLDIGSATTLYSYDFGDFETNSYYVFDKGNISLTKDYENFATLFSDLKKVHNTTDIEKISEETKKEYLSSAETLYNEGRISKAINELNRAWDLDEAKEIYENNKYYKLVKSWEAYHLIDDNEKVMYYGFLFVLNNNSFYQLKLEEKYNGFTPPDDLSEYENVYYYVEDDIIYVSKYDNGNYKATYEILSISEDRMKLKDLKENINLNFIARST